MDIDVILDAYLKAQEEKRKIDEEKMRECLIKLFNEIKETN